MLQMMYARLVVAVADLRTRDEEGQALVEYALIIALIALVAYAALQATGNNISTVFNGIATDV